MSVSIQKGSFPNRRHSKPLLCYFLEYNALVALDGVQVTTHQMPARFYIQLAKKRGGQIGDRVMR